MNIADHVTFGISCALITISVQYKNTVFIRYFSQLHSVDTFILSRLNNSTNEKYDDVKPKEMIKLILRDPHNYDLRLDTCGKSGTFLQLIIKLKAISCFLKGEGTTVTFSHFCMHACLLAFPHTSH